jgi:hypothetical protein
VAAGGLLHHVDVTSNGSELRVATYSPRIRAKKGRARSKPGARGTALTQLTPAQLAALQGIIGRAQGGAPVQLPGDVPLRQFVARDRSAQAFVPDRPGWQFDGFQGVIEGGNLAEGAFAFGVAFIVQSPNDPFRNPALPLSFFVNPDVAIATVLPQWFQICCSTAFANVQVTGLVPGSENLLPGLSGLYTARFTVNGAPWEGLFDIASTPLPGDLFGNWYVYYSYAAVALGGPPGIGSALLQTWASWDPSADQARRRNETLYTILTINFGGGPIDQDVFDAAADKWDAYIRQ